MLGQLDTVFIWLGHRHHHRSSLDGMMEAAVTHFLQASLSNMSGCTSLGSRSSGNCLVNTCLILIFSLGKGTTVFHQFDQEKEFSYT